jgi:transposase
MAARLWFDEYPYLSPENIQVLLKTKKKNGRKGRPGKDEAVETVYFVDSPLEIIPDVIEQEKTRLGRFILATNDLDLDPDSILKYYKGQQSVERGFRFLKDKSFRVAEVFLKKETRIEALSMIMVLCLFVYAVAEWHLRTWLKEMKMTVKNQLKKPIQNPTMKWIFTLFMSVFATLILIHPAIQKLIQSRYRITHSTHKKRAVITAAGNWYQSYSG